MPIEAVKLPVLYRNRSEEQKDAEKKVVTGAGVTGAAVQMSKSRPILDTFSNGQKFTKGMSAATEAAKKVNVVAKQSTGLWAKVTENFRWAKGAVLKWGDKFKSVRFIKPIIESRVFRGVSSAAGLGYGLVTFISGASEIAKTAADIKEAA